MIRTINRHNCDCCMKITRISPIMKGALIINQLTQLVRKKAKNNLFWPKMHL
jgi:hypothetical protein